MLNGATKNRVAGQDHVGTVGRKDTAAERIAAEAAADFTAGIEEGHRIVARRNESAIPDEVSGDRRIVRLANLRAAFG